MKRKTFLIISLMLVALVTLALSACTPSDPLVGKWKAVIDSDNKLYNEFVFKAEGTYILTFYTGTTETGTWTKTDDGYKLESEGVHKRTIILWDNSKGFELTHNYFIYAYIKQ